MTARSLEVTRRTYGPGRFRLRRRAEAAVALGEEFAGFRTREILGFLEEDTFLRRELRHLRSRVRHLAGQVRRWRAEAEDGAARAHRAEAAGKVVLDAVALAVAKVEALRAEASPGEPRRSLDDVLVALRPLSEALEVDPCSEPSP